jgi:hypothetical protein
LGVDEINEVETTTNEMIKGQEQLRKVEAILQSMPAGDKAVLFKFVNWNTPKTYYKIVIALDSEPNEKYNQAEIPGLSLVTFEVRMNENNYKTPQRIWTRCRDRSWMRDFLKYKEGFQPIKVGELTYEIPYVYPPP